MDLIRGPLKVHETQSGFIRKRAAPAIANSCPYMHVQAVHYSCTRPHKPVQEFNWKCVLLCVAATKDPPNPKPIFKAPMGSHKVLHNALTCT